MCPEISKQVNFLSKVTKSAKKMSRPFQNFNHVYNFIWNQWLILKLWRIGKYVTVSMSITWFHTKMVLTFSWQTKWLLTKNWLVLKLLGIVSESSNVYTRTPYSGQGQYEPLVSTQTPCISLTRGSLSWLVATREADTRGLSWYSGFVFCPHPSWGPGIDTFWNWEKTVLQT